MSGPTARITTLTQASELEEQVIGSMQDIFREEQRNPTRPYPGMPPFGQLEQAIREYYVTGSSDNYIVDRHIVEQHRKETKEIFEDFFRVSADALHRISVG